MAAPPDGPCEAWTDADAIRACCAADVPSDATDDDLELAALFASKVLHRFSGHRYPGECSDTVFPCWGLNLTRDGVLSLNPLAGLPSYPYRDASGTWRNLPVGCESCRLPEIKLPGPINSDNVVVLVDGVALDPSAYAVRGYRRLVRLDGEEWPAAQSPTLEVRFTRGRPVPDDAKRMAAIFACRKLLPLICDNEVCEIDGTPSVITRDGVTVEFEDLIDSFQEGRTGVPIVDLWLSSLPRRKRRRRKVVRADDPARGHRRFT